MEKILLLFFLLLILIFSSNCSYIFNNGTSIWIRTPYLHGTSLPPPFNVTSFLIPLGFNSSGLQNCTDADPTLKPFMNGAIVMVAPDGGCSINQHALVAQEAGAAAVLVITYGAHIFSANLQDHPSPNVLKVPVIFIEVDEFNKHITPLLTRQITVIMKVEGDKSNMDILNKGGVLFAQIFFGIITLATMFLVGFQLTRFIIKDGFQFTVANGVFILSILSGFFALMYCFDPWAYWHAIPSFTYLVLYSNFYDYFSTIGLLLVSFHLSHVVLKSNNLIKYVVIAYIGAILLMVGYTAVLIISVSFQLLNSYGKLSQNSIEKFRISIYSFIAFYVFCCTLYFVHRLVQMWSASGEQKKTTRIDYPRLVFATVGMWFVIILTIVLRGLFLHHAYSYSAIADLAIQSVGMIINPGLCVCYFLLFNPKKRETSSSTHQSINSNEMIKNDEKYQKFEN